MFALSLVYALRLLRNWSAFEVIGMVHRTVSWPSWTMGRRGAVLASGAGAFLLLNQRAHQVARLLVTMPVRDIVDVLVALGFGSAVLGERLMSPSQPG